MKIITTKLMDKDKMIKLSMEAHGKTMVIELPWDVDIYDVIDTFRILANFATFPNESWSRAIKELGEELKP